MRFWKKRLLNVFHNVGAVKRGEFKLSGGGVTDIYVDARLVTLDGRGLLWVCQGIMEVLLDETELRPMPDSYGGPVIGADPIVGALIHGAENRKGFLVRKAPKGHGLGKRIEGVVGKHPVLVEDTVNTGESLLDAALALPTKPIAAVAVVDRENGAKELLARHDIPLLSLLTLRELRENLHV